MAEFIQTYGIAILAGILIVGAVVFAIIKYTKMSPEQKDEFVSDLLNELKTSIFSLVIAIMSNEKVSFNIDLDKLSLWVKTQLPTTLTCLFEENEISEIIEKAYYLMLNKLKESNPEFCAEKSDKIVSCIASNSEDSEMFDYIYNTLIDCTNNT